MKKIIYGIVLLVLIFGVEASAEMHFVLSADSNAVIGTAQAISAGEAVKVIVLGENADIDAIKNINPENFMYAQNNILYFNVLTESEDGKEVTETIDFGSFESNKIYKVFAVPSFVVGSGSESEDFSDRYTEIGYAALDIRKTYINNIINALNESAAAVKEKLTAEGIYLGIDYGMFRLSSPDTVAEIMVNDKSRLNPDADLKEVISFINDSVFINVLNGNNSGRITAEYLESLISGDERYKDIKDIFLNIKKQYKPNILADIVRKDFKTYDELKQEIINSVYLNAFNYTDTNAENLYKILLSGADSVKPELYLDALKKMGSTARSNAISYLSNKKFNSVAELKKAIEELKINDIKTDGASGGSGGGSGSPGSAAVFTSGNTFAGLKPFTDLGDYSWAEDAVYYLLQKNIVSGYGDKRFNPGGSITRAEFVKIIVSCFFDEADETDLPFTDVGTDKWYAKYIASALKNKIVSGLSDTEFGPDRYITRQDIAVILYNTALMSDYDMDTEPVYLSDENDISEYAVAAVYALKNSGIINGYEDMSFKPKNNASRAEAVQMVYNFLIKEGELANEE